MHKDAESTNITRIETFINIVTGWHFFLSFAGLILLFFIIFKQLFSNLPSWLMFIGTISIIFLVGTSFFAGIQLRKRTRVGRTISLVINYLGFIFSFIALLQVLGVFLGVDALAKTFGSGIGWLAGVLAGYLIHAAGDQFHFRIQIEELFRKIGKYIALVFFTIFLFRVGLIKALIYLGKQIIIPTNLMIAFLVILFGIAIWLMWREETGIYLHRNNAQTEALEGYLFLSPNLLGFLIFFAFPLVFSFYISLTDWDAFGNSNFIGLANYLTIFRLNLKPLASATQNFIQVMDGSIYSELLRFNLFGKYFVLGAADARFWISLRNTLVFCIVTVPLSAIPALLLSNILNSKIPGMKIFRAIYFLPSIAAVVGISLIWQWLYNATIGYINYFITLGLQFINSIFATSYPIAQIRWLSESRTALLAIIIVSAWQTMGFNTVLFMAGLQNIPKELYEAATVDGAGRWAKFWKITLPLLAPTTFFVITTTTIQALQVFEQVFIMTNPPGSPGTSTLTIVLYLYQNGFQRFQQGYGAAIAWVLFIVIFAVTIIQFRSQRRTGAYDV
jgi:ABC-type sugar transport system permease subunit